MMPATPTTTSSEAAEMRWLPFAAAIAPACLPAMAGQKTAARDAARASLGFNISAAPDAASGALSHLQIPTFRKMPRRPLPTTQLGGGGDSATLSLLPSPYLPPLPHQSPFENTVVVVEAGPFVRAPSSQDLRNLGPIMASLHKSTQQQQQQQQLLPDASLTYPRVSSRQASGTPSGSAIGSPRNSGYSPGAASETSSGGTLAATPSDVACLLWPPAPTLPTNLAAAAAFACDGHHEDRASAGSCRLGSFAGSNSRSLGDEMEFELQHLIADAFAEVKLYHHQQQLQQLQQLPQQQPPALQWPQQGLPSMATPIHGVDVRGPSRKRLHTQTSDAVSCVLATPADATAAAAAAAAVLGDAWWSSASHGTEASFSSMDSNAHSIPAHWWEVQDDEFEQFLLGDVIMS